MNRLDLVTLLLKNSFTIKRICDTPSPVLFEAGGPTYHDVNQHLLVFIENGVCGSYNERCTGDHVSSRL
jgi:hypothetical protein